MVQSAVRLAQAKHSSPTRKKSRFMPSLEILEDRTVPSSIVNSQIQTSNTTSVAAAVPQTAVFVNDSWLGKAQGSDPDGAGLATQLGVNAFATLQEAVDAVTAGGTVNVEEGTYVGGINVNKAVTLQFFNTAEKGKAIITGGDLGGFTSQAAASGSLALNASGITIKGLTLQGSGNASDSSFGIIIVGDHGAATIQDNIITGFAIHGIGTEAGGGSSNNLLDKNRISNIGGVGVSLQGGNNNTVQFNTVSGGQANLVLDSETNATIVGNVFSQGQVGIDLFENAGPLTGTVIHLNNLSRHTTAGLVHHGAASIDAENNFWGAASGPTLASNPRGRGDKISETVPGSVDYAPWLGIAHSSSARIFTAAGATLIVNGAGGKFGFVTDTGLFVVGNKARIKKGRLQIHARDALGRKFDVVGAVNGTLTATLKAGNDRQTFTLSLQNSTSSQLLSPQQLQGLMAPSALTPPSLITTTGSTLITLNLNPLNINLLGLQVQTDPIQVTVSAQPGQGQLLGNLLTTVANLINLEGVNSALNNVLGNVVTLLNSTSLNVSGVNTTTGPLSTAQTTALTLVLDLFIAPVHVNLLGVLVDTSPIHLVIKAQSGPGLVLGNVITQLANLFNPPLPKKLDIDFINTRLTQLLTQLNAAAPGIVTSPVVPPPTQTGTQQVLSLALPPINLDLLGLNLQTSQIQVNADVQTGNGNLLGNVLTTLLNTLGATPTNLTTLNNNLNGLLAKVVGILNASSLILPPNILSTLSPVLQTLALPNLVNPTGTASTPILNLSIASPDGTSPPVKANLLGLIVTTSNIKAQLVAKTGEGKILGNLLYNTANLLNPGGTLNLLTILGQLGL